MHNAAPVAGQRFIDWLEAKLAEHHVAKIVPDEDTLGDAFRRAYETALINRAIEQPCDNAREQAAAVDVPADLVTQVTGHRSRGTASS